MKIQPAPYMTGQAAVGHYQEAFRKALANFSHQDPEIMASLSNTTYDPTQGLFTVPSFGQTIHVHYPDGKVTFANSDLLPLMGWRLVLLNYLGRADGTPLAKRLISYRELESGTVYYPAFQRESILPLGRWIKDKNQAILEQAIAHLGGTPGSNADLATVLPALPRVPVTVKMWFPDEELPGSANVLFDATANHYLHTEDLAVLGGYAVAFLIKEYQIRMGKPWSKITL